MSDIEHDPQLKWAEKIAKLLQKAEAASTEAEADAFNAAAQRIMTQYEISERLIAAAQGKQVQDKIVRETITYKGIFHRALYSIGSAVTRHNDAKALVTNYSNQTVLIVIGFETDVTNIKLLDASLQIQASTAMQRWYRGQDVAYLSKMDKYKMKREFFFGFAEGLSTKLYRARRDGVKQATAAEAERTGDAAAAQVSTDLVLKSKKAQVDDWVDNFYGTTLRTVRRNYTSGGYAARNSGYSAGYSANIGQSGLGSSRKEIES